MNFINGLKGFMSISFRGTTGVACKNLGRDFIGIELDKEYFEIAKQRIEGTQYNQQINRTQAAAPVI